ncbi:MAG: ABC transporter substrate-binding protein [Desulfobulbaceae bacterium]|nr:ABC transporter substrate-binding protein [Desulfobulbaceae bacterium]
MSRILLYFLAIFFLAQSVFAAPPTEPLRLSLMPVPDSFPAYVAEEKGFFKAEGVEVKLLPVGSAIEREQLMQAGHIDGMINEIMSAASLNRERIRVKVISIARAPLGDSPGFRLLVGKNSPITTMKDLAGVPIAVGRNTVIEYVTARMLSSLPKDAIVYQSVPVVPERMQLLMSGQVRAAVLPDQMGVAAMAAGAREIVNDLTIAQLSASAITFSVAALEGKTAAVQAFMRAWDKACAEINANPEALRPLFLQKIRLPKNIAKTYPIPPMPRHVVPSQKQWDDAMAWMKDVKLLENPPSYQDSVTDAFLP